VRKGTSVAKDLTSARHRPEVPTIFGAGTGKRRAGIHPDRARHRRPPTGGRPVRPRPEPPAPSPRSAGASMPATGTSPSGLAWSMKVSGSTIDRNFSPRSNTPSSASSCATWLPKPPTAPFLDRDQRLMPPRAAAGSARGPAAWRKRASATVGATRPGGQRLGRLQHLGQPGAKGQQRHPFPRGSPGPADLQHLPRAGISTPTPSPRG
jgi:hypothetical protein